MEAGRRRAGENDRYYLKIKMIHKLEKLTRINNGAKIYQLHLYTILIPFCVFPVTWTGDSGWVGEICKVNVLGWKKLRRKVVC